MAPLTWRNVDAPSFASANDMYRIAAGLMNSGFDAARRGVNDFRETTTDEQSAALMQSIIGAGNDTNAINAAVSGANPAFLSPGALQFANNQPGVLLDREGQALQNTGTGLQNTIRGQTIRANDFNFGRTQLEAKRADENYALLPEALSAGASIRADLASGDPKRIAAAEARQGDFLSRYGNALGINNMAQLGSFMSGNINAQTAGLGLNRDRLNYAAQLDNAIRSNDAEGITQNILGYTGNNPQEALRMAQGFTDLDYQTQQEVIQNISRFAESMPAPSGATSLAEEIGSFTGSLPASPALPTNYRAIEYNNQNADRNLPLSTNLEAVLDSVLPRYGVTARVNSGGQATIEEARAGRGTRVGDTTNHDHGNAADVNLVYQGRNLNWENPQDQPILQSIVSDIRAIDPTSQFGAGPGYMNPETTHIGTGRSAVWGAPDGEPYEALSEAFENATSGANPANAPAYRQMLDALSAGESYQAPIDPTRAQVINPDGSVSTEDTITTQIDGEWLNIPTIVNGTPFTEEEAISLFRSGQNPAVGAFQTKREAEDAAQARTDQISQMLEASSISESIFPSSGSNTSPTSTAESDLLNERLTPTVAETTGVDVPVGATDTETMQRLLDQANYAPIPEGASTGSVREVDPNSPQLFQDWDTRGRTNDINNAVNEIARQVEVGAYGGPAGGGLQRGIGNFIDYATSSPEDFQSNEAARNLAAQAQQWYQSNAAREHFQANPDQLEMAAANPVNFAMVAQEQLAAAAENQGEGTQAPSTPQSGQSPEQRPSAQRDMATAFSVVSNTSALNQSANAYRAINESIQNREQASESPTQTASRLSEGSMSDFSNGDILNGINEIMRDLGVNSATAGALLEYSGRFDNPWPIIGGDRGNFRPDINQAREIWENYNSGSGDLAGANPGVGTLVQSDAARQDEAILINLRERYTDYETRIIAALRSPETTPAEAAMLERQLEELRQFTLTQLDELWERGISQQI